MKSKNQKNNRKIAFSLSQAGKVSLGVVIGAVGAWYSFGLAMSGVTRTKVPLVALRYEPNESRALAAQAEQIFFKNPKNPSSQSRELALRALKYQLVNPSALRTLGYYADSTGDKKAALALIDAAQRLSRRDAGAQIWLLDHYARADDAKNALKHYDILLRTNPASQDVLFPRLVAAISSPDIRREIQPFLKNDKSWGPAFLAFAATTGKDLQHLVDLIVEIDAGSDDDNMHTNKVELLKRLVEGGRYDDTKRLYLTMNDARASNLASASFSRSDVEQYFGPLGWQRFELPDAGADFELVQNKPTLSIYSNPNTTRTVVRKLLYLAPGNYSLKTNSKVVSGGEGSELRWQLGCSASKDMKPNWSFPIRAPVSEVSFTIPQGCSTLALELVVSGGQGRDGVETIISNVELK